TLSFLLDFGLPTSLLPFFVFLCSGIHSFLPPFPPRRSSDLSDGDLLHDNVAINDHRSVGARELVRADRPSVDMQHRPELATRRHNFAQLDHDTIPLPLLDAGVSDDLTRLSAFIQVPPNPAIL